MNITRFIANCIAQIGNSAGFGGAAFELIDPTFLEVHSAYADKPEQSFNDDRSDNSQSPVAKLENPIFFPFDI